MIRLLSIIFFVVLMFIPMAQAADSFESNVCVSGTTTIVHNSKESTLMGYELKGLVLSASNSEIFNNATEMCVGVFKRMGKVVTQNGICKYLYPNDDIHLLEYHGDSNGGEWKFLSGTGKWEGLKGSGTYSTTQRGKTIVPGTFQNCRNIKGTYELPK